MEKQRGQESTWGEHEGHQARWLLYSHGSVKSGYQLSGRVEAGVREIQNKSERYEMGKGGSYRIHSDSPNVVPGPTASASPGSL